MDERNIQRWIEASFQLEATRNEIPKSGSAEELQRQWLTITVRVTVSHSHKDIGLFELRDFCWTQLFDTPHALGEQTLEEVCEEMMRGLNEKYPNRAWETRILENGESGAVLQYEDAA